MSEETQSVELGIDQLLAAVLSVVGPVQFNQKTLLADYSNFAVSINKGDADNLEISLVDLDGVDLDDIAE